ncbi:MAG: dephospho-CoA kinase [Pseudomonadota bacterium]
MIVIGLTGGIAMGKSTVARQFELLGAKTCSADACVHKLMRKGGKAVALIKKHFPSSVKDEEVDRKILGKIVFADKEKLIKLENILHPLVQEMENDFVRRMRNLGTKFVVLDIPLLFETNGHERVDFTVVVSAPAFIQKQRVMARQGMTAERFEKIIASQMQDLEKRNRADFVIPTGLGKGYSFRAVKQLVSHIKE